MVFRQCSCLILVEQVFRTREMAFQIDIENNGSLMKKSVDISVPHFLFFPYLFHIKPHLFKHLFRGNISIYFAEIFSGKRT